LRQWVFFGGRKYPAEISLSIVVLFSGTTINALMRRGMI